MQIQNYENYEMRQYKAKVKYNGVHLHANSWIEGSLIKSHDKYFIHYLEYDNLSNLIREIDVEILPETICQGTGLLCTKGKKEYIGKEIFEYDIFREEKENEIFEKVVIWLKERGAFYLVPIEHCEILKNNNCEKEKEFEWLFEEALLYDFSIDVGLAKTRNLYD
jgi:hypothetical protein